MKSANPDVGTSFLLWPVFFLDLGQILAILAVRSPSQRANARPDAQSSRLQPQTTMADHTQDLPRTPLITSG